MEIVGTFPIAWKAKNMLCVVHRKQNIEGWKTAAQSVVQKLQLAWKNLYFWAKNSYLVKTSYKSLLYSTRLQLFDQMW